MKLGRISIQMDAITALLNSRHFDIDGIASPVLVSRLLVNPDNYTLDVYFESADCCDVRDGEAIVVHSLAFKL